MMQKQLVVWCVLATIAVSASVSLALTGCRKEQGPAERAGAKIDRAADRAGDAVEDTGRKINKALPGD